jgi:hypothetical protein
MPHRSVRAPGHDRSKSLGWLALAWLEFFTVHGRGDVRGEPVVHGDEMSGFVADCYALEASGRRLYDSAFYSRPKGADKSGLGARYSLFEGLGPCRFDGWARGGEVYVDPWRLGFEYRYAKGEPMGRPVRAPFIRILATEEGQTGNVYDSIHYNLAEGPLSAVPGVDVGLTRTFLPGGGEIVPSTSGAASKDGGLETFTVFDESHLYVLPELRDAYGTVTRNLRKRKASAGTWYLETTTMFAAGQDSVAEGTYKLAEAVEGKRNTRTSRMLYDHRFGECEDLTDVEALRAAITDAFGEAIGWQDLESLVDEFYDPRSSPADSRRYFLNAPSSTADAWIREHEWSARRPRDADGQPIAVEIGPREPVVLGFDGSRRRARGVTDSTALIGCRVSDGHLFQVRVWEQPPGPAGDDWEVPRTDVDAAIEAAFGRYAVVALYCDPAKWESNVAAWEAKYGGRLLVKASAKHPCEWWMTGGTASRVVAAIKSLQDAILDGDMSHDGASTLTTHVLNARRRESRQGWQIAKPHPESPQKIDAAVAAVLAWQARLDALAAGVRPKNRYVPRRVY